MGAPMPILPIALAFCVQKQSRAFARFALRRSAPAAIGILQACAPAPHAGLSEALQGIQKPQFLTCSGPPLLEWAEGGESRMSFLTDLRRGEAIGVTPLGMPVQSCSVDAVFSRNQLITSSFGGNMTMCQMVFAPCLSHRVWR
jgi:hypothetical protein